VTVGLPVYNEEAKIRRALDSLLAQTFRDFEIVISDNASTDGTERICLEYADRDKRIRYLRNEINRGIIFNFNRVAELAGGRYFMWAAADDWWHPKFIHRLVQELDRHPQAGVAMSALRRLREDGTVFQTHRFEGAANPSVMSHLMLLMGMASANTPFHFFIYGLFRAEIIKEAVRSPAPDVPAADRLLMCRIALATRFRYVDEFLHDRTVRDKPLVERHSQEQSMKFEADDPLAYTRTWLIMEKYLRESAIIPEHRKRLIPLAADTFAETRPDVLYRPGLGAPLNDVMNCSDDLAIVDELARYGLAKDAHRYASELAIAFPGNVGVLNKLAETKLRLGQKNAAIGIWSDILAARPRNETALRALAAMNHQEAAKR